MSSVHQVRRVFLVALFCLAQGLFLFSSVFVITGVRVKGASVLTPTFVVQQTAIRVGTYYWAYLGSGVRNRLLSIPAVADADVSLDCAGVVWIDLQERVPVASLFTGDIEHAWVDVDEAGTILRYSPANSKLPRLRVDHPVPLAGRVDPGAILVLLEVIRPISKSLPEPVESYYVDGMQCINANTVFLGTTVTVRLGTPDKLDSKLNILRSLLEELKARGQKVSLIDVRFSRPVVRPFVKVAPPVIPVEPVVEVVDQPTPSASPTAPSPAPLASPSGIPSATPAPGPEASPVASPEVASTGATEPVAQPAKQPAPQQVTRPVSQPISRPVPQQVSRPVSQPITRPVSQPTARTTARPAPAQTPATRPEPAPKPMPQPIPSDPLIDNDPVIEPLAQ